MTPLRAIPLLALLALLERNAAAAGGPSCHIHPPVSGPGAPPPPIIGPYATGAACEKANALMFDGQGRCHCAFDFGNRGGWPPPGLPPSPEDPAFDLPRGR